MKTLIHSMIPSALVGVALLGCDLASDRAESPSPESEAMSALPAADVLAEALSDPDAYARARELGTLLPTLGPESVPAVVKTLEKFHLDLGAVEFELLLHFWASHEPAEATGWTFKKSPPLFRIAAARTTVEAWAEADPPAAVVAVESALAESSEDVARVSLMALVRGWSRTDRPGLEKYIYDLGSSVKRQRAIYAYALALAADDGSNAVIRWGESVPGDDRRYKLEVFRQVMSALTWADTAAAMRFCESHCDGPYGKGLRNTIIRARLRNGEDGGDIVTWISRAPDGDEEQQANKRHSLWVAYALWAYHDREAALVWMAEETSGEPEPWVRHLYGEYARQIAAESPAEAISWAEQVEDDQERELTLVRIARAWRQQEPEAAEAWLSQSSLPEAARQKARDATQPTYLPTAPVE